MERNFEYRNCVVGVFVREDGLVLVGERGDVKGAWQLPQGGVEPGESTLSALYREMSEEIGCSDFAVVGVASRQVRYAFPKTLGAKLASKYAGQVQQWYRLKFAQGATWDASKSDGEFRDFAWRPVADIVGGIIDWKRDAYREGFRLIGLEV